MANVFWSNLFFFLVNESFKFPSEERFYHDQKEINDLSTHTVYNEMQIAGGLIFIGPNDSQNTL